ELYPYYTLSLREALLICRVHTAVKIAAQYEGPVIYVPDASRSVGVATNLMSDNVDAYLAEVADEYELVRTRHANRKATPLVTLADRKSTRLNSSHVKISY